MQTLAGEEATAGQTCADTRPATDPCRADANEFEVYYECIPSFATSGGFERNLRRAVVPFAGACNAMQTAMKNLRKLTLSCYNQYELEATTYECVDSMSN